MVTMTTCGICGGEVNGMSPRLDPAHTECVKTGDTRARAGVCVVCGITPTTRDGPCSDCQP